MKKRIAVSGIIFLALILGTFSLNIFVNKKIEENLEAVLKQFRSKTGVEVNIEGIDIKSVSQEIYFKKIEFNSENSFFAGLFECKLQNIGKLYFLKDKNVLLNCKSSSVDAIELVNIFKGYFSTGRSVKEKKPASGKKHKLSLSIEKAALKLNEKVKTLSFHLTFENSFGKILIKELLNKEKEGVAEIAFDSSFTKTNVLLNGISFDAIESYVAYKAGLNEISGTVDGFVNITRDKKMFSAETDLVFKELSFSHKLVDSAPFALSFSRFSGFLKGEMESREFNIENSKISLGGIEGELSLKREEDKTTAVFEMEKVPLNKLVTLAHSRAFKGYLFGGELSLNVTFLKQDGEEPTLLVAGEVFEPVQLSERLDYLKQPFLFDFTDKNGLDISFMVGEQNKNFIPLDFIPDHIVRAVVISEDAGFFNHKGVDFEEISAALKDSFKKRKMRGGSTITQQLAKNLFLSGEKTLLRKFREVLLAIELDATLSKKRMLEIYLNIVEWAPGIFGIVNASWHYFGKPVYLITPLEAAYLASVLPGPYKYHYQYLNNKVSEKWMENLYRILSVMNDAGYLTLQEYLSALKEELTFYPKD
ncbi:MAG: transglycosylase domain-containing protein [bacterium]